VLKEKKKKRRFSGMIFEFWIYTFSGTFCAFSAVKNVFDADYPGILKNFQTGFEFYVLSEIFIHNARLRLDRAARLSMPEKVRKLCRFRRLRKSRAAAPTRGRKREIQVLSLIHI
jgi:hypothetical protein